MSVVATQATEKQSSLSSVDPSQLQRIGLGIRRLIDNSDYIGIYNEIEKLNKSDRIALSKLRFANNKTLLEIATIRLNVTSSLTLSSKESKNLEFKRKHNESIKSLRLIEELLLAVSKTGQIPERSN